MSLPAILGLMVCIGYAALNLNRVGRPAMLAVVGFGMFLCGRLFYSTIVNQALSLDIADHETVLGVLNFGNAVYYAVASLILLGAIFYGRSQPEPDDGFGS